MKDETQIQYAVNKDAEKELVVPLTDAIPWEEEARIEVVRLRMTYDKFGKRVVREEGRGGPKKDVLESIIL